MKSMALISRGPGGAGAKTPPPLETSPPALVPRNPAAVKPAVLPKPQVRTPTKTFGISIRSV